MGSLSDEALRQQLNQTAAECDRLREVVAARETWYSPNDYQNLAEIIHRLELEREELRRELAEARSQPTPGTLPDAAELLNALKSSNPKSKASLRDVEAILEAVQEG